MDQQQGSQSDTPQPSQPAAVETQSESTPAQEASLQQETPQANPNPVTSSTPSSTPPSSEEPRILTSETTPPGKPKGTYFVVGIAVIIIIVGGAYITMTKHNAKPTTLTQNINTQTASVTPSPGVTPVTPANVDQTLNNVNTTMQQTVNQANTDLTNVSNIDTSQDNTSGL